MALRAWLRRFVGLDGFERETRGVSVPVEREPDAESERAVKEPASSPDETTEASSSERPDRRPAPGTDAAGDEPVDSLSGIGPAYAERLGEAGVETLADLAAADPGELAAATGIGEGRLSGWIERARER